MSHIKQPETLEEMIILLEDSTWKAMEDSGKKLLPFLTDDCIMIIPPCFKLSKNSEPTLRETLESPVYVPWTGHKMSDIEINVIGRDGAIISYKVEATRPAADESDEDDVFMALVSSTWRRDEDTGRLLLCHSQQTPFENV